LISASTYWDAPHAPDALVDGHLPKAFGAMQFFQVAQALLQSIAEVRKSFL